MCRLLRWREMPREDDVGRGNRRGCLIMTVIAVVFLLLLAILALRTGDLQQANEAVSAAPAG